MNKFIKGKGSNYSFAVMMGVSLILPIGFMEYRDWFNARTAFSDPGYDWTGFIFGIVAFFLLLTWIVWLNWKDARHGLLYLLSYFVIVMDVLLCLLPVLIVSGSPRPSKEHVLVPNDFSAMLWCVSFAVAGFVVSHGKLHRRASSYAALRIAYGWYGMLLCMGAACAASVLGVGSTVRRVVVIAALAVMIVCFLYMIQGLMLRYGTTMLNRASEMLWAMHLRRRQFSDEEVQVGSCFAGLKQGGFSPVQDKQPVLDAWSSDMRHELGSYVKARRPRPHWRLVSGFFGMGIVAVLVWNAVQVDWGNLHILYEILHKWVAKTGFKPYQIAGMVAVAASCVAIPYNVWAYYLDALGRVHRYFKHHPLGTQVSKI